MMKLAQVTITAEELRVAIFRSRIPFYIVAARIGLHPATLGKTLNGKRPLRPELAERILRAIEEPGS